jgi:hypothetical protein
VVGWFSLEKNRPLFQDKEIGDLLSRILGWATVLMRCVSFDPSNKLQVYILKLDLKFYTEI